MADIRQTTTYTRGFLLVQSSDHITGLTGATPVVEISKNGAAFTTATAVVTELSYGWYKAALKTSDTSVMGDLVYHITATSGDPTDFTDQIVGYDPTASTVTTGTNLDKTAYLISGTVTTGTNLDKAGYSLSQAFPSNFASMLISGGGIVTASISGTVTTGTNLDKTGYSLSQSFPSNFATMLISGGGIVSASISGTVTTGTNLDKTGYSLSQAFPPNFSALAVTGGGAITVGTNNDKSGYTISGTVTTGTNLDKSGYSINGTVTTGTLLDKTGFALSAAGAAAIATTQMTESYAALHTAPTLAQILFEMRGHHAEKQVTGTSVTVFGIDGATEQLGYRLNDTSPTLITRVI